MPHEAEQSSNGWYVRMLTSDPCIERAVYLSCHLMVRSGCPSTPERGLHFPKMERDENGFRVYRFENAPISM